MTTATKPTTLNDYNPYNYPSEWYPEVAKLNIYQRLHGAMTDAKPIEKTEKSGIKYKFHGHEAVSIMVKGLAEKWGFVIHSSVVDHELQTQEIYGKPRPLTVLTVQVRFVNIDNPEEFVDSIAVGYGVDESDKGPGKALSYALKMAQLKAFLIHDGEELDNEAFRYPDTSEIDAEFNDVCKKYNVEPTTARDRLAKSHNSKWGSLLDSQKRAAINALHEKFGKPATVPANGAPADEPAPTPAPAPPAPLDDIDAEFKAVCEQYNVDVKRAEKRLTEIHGCKWGSLLDAQKRAGIDKLHEEFGALEPVPANGAASDGEEVEF